MESNRKNVYHYYDHSFINRRMGHTSESSHGLALIAEKLTQTVPDVFRGSCSRLDFP